MKRSSIECDGCGHTHETEPVCYGGTDPSWIEISKVTSSSGEKLSAGVSHFCSEECLADFMQTGVKTRGAVRNKLTVAQKKLLKKFRKGF